MVRNLAIALLSTLFIGTTAFAADAVVGSWKLNLARRPKPREPAPSLASETRRYRRTAAQP
jgi:hypothetical protein